MSAGGESAASKRIDLALQGGGPRRFHLGRARRLLEDERIDIEGICGTSAGAVNVLALAHGMTEGSAAGARETLDRFWQGVGETAWFSLIRRSPLDRLLGTWRLDHSPGYLVLDYRTRILSPYQTNPFDYDLLERVLADVVDFARL
jgi:NTE family protein